MDMRNISNMANRVPAKCPVTRFPFGGGPNPLGIRPATVLDKG